MNFFLLHATDRRYNNFVSIFSAMVRAENLVLKNTYKAVLRQSGSWRGPFQWKKRGIKG